MSSGDTTEGGITLLVEASRDTETTKQESLVWLRQSQSLDVQPCTGTINTHYGTDFVSLLAFQIPWAVADAPPDGFPFCFIRQLSLYLVSTIYTPKVTLHWTGRQLWCLVQTLPQPRRAALLRAARQGFVLFQDTDFWPRVNFRRGQWSVEWDREAYHRHWAEREKALHEVLAERIPVAALAHLVVTYATQQCPDVRLQVSQRGGFVNDRMGLDAYATWGVLQTFHWEVQQPTKSVSLAFPRDYWCELHVVVERGDRPYTFYSPDEHPLTELSLWDNGVLVCSGRHGEWHRSGCRAEDHRSGCRAEDDHLGCRAEDDHLGRWISPTPLAHYTCTLSRWHYKYHPKMLDGPADVLYVERRLQCESLEMRVQASPHLDPQARIHVWVVHPDGLGPRLLPRPMCEFRWCAE